ncbi:FUSC family protein [Glaciihabitans sp. INWT7]|uniref:FUSC family protein n=1 Tax=Glaciihabitans sp. INWT7 TaxID=2596912 RepID=UPI00162A9B52|nr:FUSC family protein [Glaciihabitans sp. INWT7]QNE47822.1 FUSC family protein [Glaciihabitans sp. INWT7]
MPQVFDLRSSGRRTLESIVPALQIVIASSTSYAVAHYLLGHAVPLLAVTVTISSLGFVRDARPIRVLETAIGIIIGIVLSEALLLTVGQGLWQVALVLMLTLIVARALSPSNAFAVAAGVQSMLVMLLPVPAGGPFVRSIDGIIAGVVALIVTALLPRDPRRLARQDARRLFASLTEALDSLVVALERADEPSAERALERLRTTQPVIDSWAASLDSAAAIARISPFLRRRRPDLLAQTRVLRGMDLATRNLRVIARRIDFLVRDGAPRPGIASIMASLGTSVELLGQSLDDPLLADTVRVGLVAVAERLRPDTVVSGAPVTDSVVILMMRPLLVDLLTAADLPAEKARALLPEL